MPEGLAGLKPDIRLEFIQFGFLTETYKIRDSLGHISIVLRLNKQSNHHGKRYISGRVPGTVRSDRDIGA